MNPFANLFKGTQERAAENPAYRQAFLQVYNPAAYQAEAKDEALRGAATRTSNAYMGINQTMDQSGLTPGSKDWWRLKTRLASESGDPQLVNEVAYAYEKDQQNYDFNPQADPMLTNSYKDFLLEQAEGYQGNYVDYQNMDANRKVARTSIHMPKIDFQMPGNSQDRYLTADEMKTLVDKDGNVFPFGTTVSQAYAAGARPKSEAKAEQMKAGAAAQTMKLAEDQYSKNEMTTKERTPALNSDYVRTGLQNMFLDAPIPQVIKAPIVGERAQARKSAQDFWVEFPLRSESGATITVPERESWGDMHFPKQGDSDVEVARKKARRILLQTIKERAAAGTLPNSFVDASLLPDGSRRVAQVQLQGMDAPAQIIMSPEGGYMIKSAQGNFRTISIEQLNEILKGGQR